MNLVRRQLRFFCVSMTILTLLITTPIQPIFAAMVTTESTVGERALVSRENLKTILAREDVQRILMSNGIDPDEAQARINSLSDSEVVSISEKIDNLPAGGNGIGVIVGALLIVFLVLLFTDIMGYTDIFPFVKSTR